MTPAEPSQAARWARIGAHPIAGAQARHFEDRVAREQHWSRRDALAAIEEYRRFAFLSCLGEEVTPSKAVDAVWHVHLLYTRDYWLVFCPDVLGMALHHSPGGGARDNARFASQYRRTLALYETHFGPPPARWWPRRDEANAPDDGPAHGTERAGLALALAAIPAFAVAAARPANPLDWTGPDFLVLYLVLMLVVMFGTPLWRRWLRSRGSESRDPGMLSPLEAGYLAGGAARAVDAGVATLHHRGVLRWDSHMQRFERQRDADRLDSPLRELAELFSGRNAKDGMARANAVVAPVRDRLEQRGLVENRAQARRIATWTVLPAVAVLLFGVAKIAIGIQRDRPVTSLVIMCVILAIYALIFFFGGADTTRAGRQALARTKAASRVNKQGRIDDIALAVAFGGTALLAGTALAGYHDVRAPAPDPSPSDSSSSSSSSDSSDSAGSSDSGGSSCGSSCGGCGGGGGD